MDRGQHAKPKPGFLKKTVMVATLIAVAFLATSFSNEYLVQAYAVPSGSMEPTVSTGERVIAEQVSYYFRDVEPGDIIVFKDPENSSRYLLKRCIAVAGQTIDFKDGITYIDGADLSEPYTYGKPTYPLNQTIGEIAYPYTVPKNSIWVMGDNRTNSKDSRYFGSVEISAVQERVCFIFWPFDDFGPIK